MKHGEIYDGEVVRNCAIKHFYFSFPSVRVTESVSRDIPTPRALGIRSMRYDYGKI